VKPAAALSIRFTPRPGQIADITLQEGGQFVGAGPVAAGNTVRRIIGDNERRAGRNKAHSNSGQVDPA
jgi:hypothetical protein